MLCNEIASIRCPSEQLKILKERYQTVINSNRRLENIRSLSELIKVLEKRNYLNSSNTQALSDIASEFKQPEVLHSLRNVQIEDNHVNCNACNSHSPEEYSGFVRIPKSTKDRVYKCIAEGIGQKWTDFARALGIPEGDIDDLNTVRSTSARAYKILAFHEQNCDRYRWRSKLLEALTDARRKDLRLKVQDIFDFP
ncbi:Fas (TNFRSF6)-associated via death domain [Tribolium castaneum]|uniref:Fas (TNFRSF6)-associated via death domain n=2 Tax=Tribolium castaneum TaxID=7070 RepID=D6WJL3_TRICA|nr:Fas (TNFRSF6)-associated via death domain [Tribolium castaneum]